MSNHSHVIAVDWGTSRLRVYLCQVEENSALTLVEKSHGLGVNKVTTSFEDALMNCIEPWVKCYGKLPILMAGQIGSSIGWKETKYLSCPIAPTALASACLEFEANGHQIHIVPGLSCQLKNDNYDAMRGEELQVLGWLQLDEKNWHGEHLICLPGTHTKWVFVKDGKILRFKTAMTGELYDLLTNNSVLIQEVSSEFDEASFTKGAHFTLNSELGSFTHGLFSVRSKQLFGELSAVQANSYLSGVLIGSDVRAAVNASEWQWEDLTKVSIIGAEHLSQCFEKVLSSHGIATECYKVADTTLLGFSLIHQRFIQH